MKFDWSSGFARWRAFVSRLPVARARALWARLPIARLCDGLTLLWLVVFHHIVGARFRHAPFGFDEHYFLHEGWSVTKGLVPYRDLQEFKPPMIFCVTGLGVRLFGVDDLAYRNVFALLTLAAFLVLAVALLTRGTTRLLVAALGALFIDHFFDRGFHDSSIVNAETLGLAFFCLGCGVLLLRTDRTRLQQVAGGAILTLAPLAKEPLAFVVLTAWLALLLLHRAESPGPGAVLRFAKFTIAGVAGVMAIWLFYLLVTRSLMDYVAMLKLSMVYTKKYAQQLNWFPKSPTGGVLAEYWRRLRGSYLNAAHLGVFVPLALAPLLLWTDRRRLVGAVTIATVIAALYAVTIGNGFVGHYYVMAMTGTVLCAAIGALALDESARRSGEPMRRWVAGTFALTAFLVAGPRFYEDWSKRGSFKTPPPPVSRAEIDLVRAHSAPGDRIWTLGDPLLYVYSDRTTAFREGIVIDELISYYPGDTDEQRLAPQKQEILRRRPKVIIFGDDPVLYKRKQRYIKALVNPVLQEGHYVKVSDKFYVAPP